ncbi:MAG: hypothetical protein XD87_0139 [candidate division WS6 bacterium 36_33]|uniref:Uncharacterized protein n=1 Tax=candidate division WS6 bacterium 36_33 TaxID=1641388 RepID=A0A124FU46_9BACT|nr:MAG: hypothetical protein XD87_0139 [candidate division WS6 bacterium 36_33]
MLNLLYIFMNPIKDLMKDISSNFILLGILTILFAILIIFLPDILTYTIAIMLLISGMTALYYGFRIKKSIRKSNKFWKKYFKELDEEEGEIK